MDSVSFRHFERCMYYLASPFYCDKPRFLWVLSSKKIGDFGFFFFFFFFCGLVVVVGGVADGKGGCGWCCGFFFGSGIYNFIVGDILFYCDIYIILLC